MRTLHGYFDQYDMEHIDSVVLGCTHFVFYRDYFRELLPERAAVIDGNEGTVRHLGVVLESLGKLAPEDATGGVELANSDPSERIAELSRKLLNRMSQYLAPLSEGSQGRTRQIHSTLPISLSVQHA